MPRQPPLVHRGQHQLQAGHCRGGVWHQPRGSLCRGDRVGERGVLLPKALVRGEGAGVAGKIDQHIGDAVMALWGTDQSRKDDPERAILAALEMQAAIQQITSPG